MVQFSKALLVLAAVLVMTTPMAYSQTTFATITGSVMDSTGAVVPNATVTVTNVETNVKRTTQSNEAGNYTVAQLNQGTYTLAAKAAGFKEFVARDIVLLARDARRVDVKLEVGALETAVEVSGGATLIETETARIADVKNTVVLNTLPLNTRGMWSYLALAPGVQQQSGTSVVRFAGSRAIQANWSIDGTTFADGVDNTATGPLANYIESFEEIKIDLANNSAEFSALGQVTVISKSGTNDLHGVIFDYYSTPWFRARGPFDVARGTGIRHWPGGSIGGPVFIPKLYDGRNKTFFFYSFETSRGSQVTQNLNSTVPLEPWRQGDFSGLPVTIYDPAGGRPFPGNRIPADRLNPVAVKLQDRFYPLPNFGDTAVLRTNNFRLPKTRSYDPSTYWVTRIDHHFSDRDTLFGRYTWQRLYNNTYEGNLPTIGRRYQERNDRAATASYTHTFRPTLMNEIRWGFGFNNNPVIPPINGPDMVKELGLVGLVPDLPNIPGMLRINWSGIGLRALSQPNYTSPGYRTHTEDVQEHLSWFRGRHNLKFGYNLFRSEYDAYSANTNLFGSVTFNGKFTNGGTSGQGHPYADFLLGLPSAAARASAPIPVERNRWSHDFYALDDFKVTPQLTLSMGVRYELHLPWRENADRMAIFDIGTGKIIVPDGSLSKVSPIFPKGYVDIVEASSVGAERRTLMHPDRNNIAPRIGIAWRPLGPNTVFRAGYGIFYDIVPLIYDFSIGGIPYLVNEPGYTNPTSNPQVVLPRVFPASGTGGPTTVSLPAARNLNLATPYSMQYNFTIEHQRWNTGFRVSYVGTGMRKGGYGYNYNSPVPDSRPFTAKSRPFPNYPGITYITNGAGHQYNGLTAEVLRHLAGGLYLQSTWTWARDRYDMDYNWDFDNWLYTPENPFDRRREIAPAQDIPTHRWNSNWIYQLPFGKGKHWMGNASRVANLLVGGWEISGIFATQTGMFLTPFWTGPDPVGIAYTTSDAPDVTIRPDILRNPNLPKDQHSLSGWFDTGAFAAPKPGNFGTSAKGVIKGPGVNVWHMGFHKDFFFFQEKNARLRWEMTATNIFNHPNWSNPGTDMSDAVNFGVISSAAGVNNSSTGDRTDARSFRMGLRFQW